MPNVNIWIPPNRLEGLKIVSPPASPPNLIELDVTVVVKSTNMRFRMFIPYERGLWKWLMEEPYGEYTVVQMDDNIGGLRIYRNSSEHYWSIF